MVTSQQSATDITSEIEQIRSRMNGQDYYLMQHTLLGEASEDLVLQHYNWFIELEKNGDILLTGAQLSRDGSRLPGMTIFRAESWEAAEALAVTDPFVRAGVRSFQIEQFRLGGGRIMLSYDLSDRSCRFT